MKQRHLYVPNDDDNKLFSCKYNFFFKIVDKEVPNLYWYDETRGKQTDLSVCTTDMKLLVLCIGQILSENEIYSENHNPGPVNHPDYTDIYDSFYGKCTFLN